jgi:hypothetical protein
MAFQFPNPNLTPEFTGSNGITYVWDAGDGKWSIKGFSADFDDRYVNEEGGDTMEGQLVIDGPRKAGDDPINPNLVSSVKVLSIDNAQNSSLQLRHGGNAKIYIGPTDVAIASDIKFNRDAGSIVRTNDADLINIAREEVSYTGNIENEKNLVTKKYVDDADEELRQQIITIDEELESIVPSIERGQWTYEQAQNPFRPPAAGKYFLIKGITAADQIGLAQFTEDYTESTGAVFSATDHVGTNHTWSDVEDGKLIDLLDKPDPDGLFGTITEVNTAYHSSGAAIIMWDAIQSLGSPTNKQPYLTNVKIFEKPTGGDVSDFVKKSGDEMSGPLTFETAQDNTNYSITTNQARIAFKNTTSGGGKKTINLYQAGNNNLLVTDSYLMSKESVYTGDYFYGWDGGSGSSAITYSPRIQITSSAGHLKYGSSKSQLTWDTNGVTIPRAPGVSSNGDGFTVEGKINTNGYSEITYNEETGKLLVASHNANETDAIWYQGRITDPKHLATKEYVDEKAGSGSGTGQPYDKVLDNLLYFGKERILSKSSNPTSMNDIVSYAPSTSVYGYFISKERFADAINENVPLKNGWTAYNGSDFGFIMYDGSGGLPSNYSTGTIQSVQEKTLSGIEGYFFKFSSSLRTRGNAHGDFCIINCGVRGEKVISQKLGFGKVAPKFYITAQPHSKGGENIVRTSSRAIFLPINWLKQYMGISPSVFLESGNEFSFSFEKDGTNYSSSVIKYEDAVKADGRYWGWNVSGFSRDISDSYNYNFTIYRISNTNIISNAQGEFIYS